MSADHCGGATALVDAPAGTTKFALVGNPNTGKSTLFNALTGLRTKVANYPGVTVSRYLGTVDLGDGQKAVIEDLPGTYSLDAISPDEQIVTDVLTKDSDTPDALLVIAEATNLQLSLNLLAQALQTELPAMVVLTFGDELARRSGSIDMPALSVALGVPVVAVNAGNRNQLMDLRALMRDYENWSKPTVAPPTDPTKLPAWIDSVLSAASYKSPQIDERSRKIDDVLLHPVWGSVIFFAVMFLFFQMIFTVAQPFQGWIEDGFAWLSEQVSANVEIPWLASFLADGLIGGVGGVLVFVPQIALLFLMIAILESTGYMSRAAFLMDRVMGTVGLEGRAFVSMLSGMACAIPAIMSTRSLPSARDRLTTIMTVPLMTCSARLPVYVLLVGMLVPDEIFGLQGVVMFGLYLFGAFLTMTAAWVSKKFFGGRGPALPFFMEMPSYQPPQWRSVGTAVWDSVKMFLTKVGRIILILTIALWALVSLPSYSDEQLAAAGVDLEDSAAVATYQIDNSAAAAVAKTVQPVFAPLGYDWRITASVLSSLGAREVFVSTLGMLASAEDPEEPRAEMSEMVWLDGEKAGEPLFTPDVIVSLLLFFAIALQCTSTLAVMRRETGTWKWPLIAFGYMGALAWLTAFLGRMITLAIIG